jgi:hypothetical protein
MGTLFGDVVEIGKHLTAEMREDNALGSDFGVVLRDIGIVAVTSPERAPISD